MILSFAACYALLKFWHVLQVLIHSFSVFVCYGKMRILVCAR